MSKRFGRNQKRQARDEIARLRRELDLAITGGFAPARGRYQSLDDFVEAYLEVDVREIEDTYTIRREASIRFVPIGRSEYKTMIYASAYSGLVEWRGVVWQIMMPHRVEISEVFYDAEVVEFDLRAIGDRDSARKPLCYPENATITRHRQFTRKDRIAA